MTEREHIPVEPSWARVGVLLNCEPAEESPDLERLILATARALPGHARLLPLVVTWLVRYGGFVARHRLRRLVVQELGRPERAALGLLLETAIEHGATAELRIVVGACEPASRPGPLFDVYRGESGLEAVAEQNASTISRRWGVWAPEVELKDEAVRPVRWLLEQNPAYGDRIVRKGDLRCSILEVLRHDAGGEAKSEAELARASGATRAAVSKALDALVREGRIVIAARAGNRRDHRVILRGAA